MGNFYNVSINPMLNCPLSITVLYLSQHRSQIIHIDLKYHPNLSLHRNQTPKTNFRPHLRQNIKIIGNKTPSTYQPINNIKIITIFTLVIFQYSHLC